MPDKIDANRAVWFARIVVGIVFVVNVWCALVFIFDPATYVAGFELSNVPGRIVVQSFGILFLMWNATYPPVLFDPLGQRTMFAVVLVQQAIGVMGETWLALTLPAGYSTLMTTGLRFMVFDGLGLMLLILAFILTNDQ